MSVQGKTGIDSCCGVLFEGGKINRISMPDPARILPSDLELTEQVIHMKSAGQTWWSQPVNPKSDIRIDLQFHLEDMKNQWKSGTDLSDQTIDLTFRVRNIRIAYEEQAGDLFIHQQFRSDLM